MMVTKDMLMGKFDWVTCGSYVIDSQSRLLIVHPTGYPDDHWTIPKGLVDDGEDLYSAAIRELREETSINIDAYTYEMHQLGVIGYATKNKALVGFAFFIDGIITQDIICTSFFTDLKTGEEKTEVDAYKWVEVPLAMPIIQPEQRGLFRSFTL